MSCRFVIHLHNMRAQLGIFVSAVAGSIGGTTFQGSSGGLSVRVKPLPRHRSTTYQSGNRHSLQLSSRSWRLLTPTQRDDWNTAAGLLTWHNRFGVVIPGKGYWLFTLANQNLFQVGLPPLTSPGAVPAFPPVLFGGFVVDTAPTMEWSWSFTPAVPSGAQWLIYAAPPGSAGISKPFGPLRLVTAMPSGTTSPFDFAAAYTARFGVFPVPGQQVFAKMVQLDEASGIVDSGLPFSAICT